MRHPQMDAPEKNFKRKISLIDMTKLIFLIIKKLNNLPYLGRLLKKNWGDISDLYEKMDIY